MATRRAILQAATAVAGTALLERLLPAAVARAATLAASHGQQPAAPVDALTAFRTQFAGNPIQSQSLGDHLTLLSGPGGSVVVLDGTDGKVVVDTFVAPAWPKLNETLHGLGKSPVKFVIDTHWHFDHTDNNARLHAAGATVVANENTKKRMTERHELAVLGLKIPPSPAAALPQRVFKESYTLHASGESVALLHIPPAHTDSDVLVHFEKANVLHTGDVFFNGMYPYIDGSTGGSVAGMLAGAEKILALADANTKIVCGHGALGTKADVVKYRDMLAGARDRVQQLKTAGKSMQEAIAAKPFTDLEAAWGHGLFNGDTFVQIVYLTI